MTGQGYRYKINTFWNGLRDEKQHGDCKQQTIFNWFPGINVEISPRGNGGSAASPVYSSQP